MPSSHRETHPFLAADRTLADVALLEHLLDRLRSLRPSEIAEAKGDAPLILYGAEPDGRSHRVIVARGGELLAPGPRMVVGFFGLKRPDYDRELLDRLDRELIAEFPSFPHVLSYSTIEIGAGNHANMLFLRGPEGIEHWRSGTRHAQAVRDHAHLIYEAIRLHNAVLDAGLGAREPLRVLRSKYYDYLHPAAASPPLAAPASAQSDPAAAGSTR